MQRDWNDEAKRAANLVSHCAFETHRGFGPWTRETSVIFGNDGYTQDERSRLTVDLIRQRLEIVSGAVGQDVGELGFAVCDEFEAIEPGYTWAMIINLPFDRFSEDAIKEMLFQERRLATTDPTHP